MNAKIESILKTCLRKGVSEEDLGFMLKWAFACEDNYIKFLHMLETHSQEKFFDRSERIAGIANHFREQLEREIASNEQ